MPGNKAVHRLQPQPVVQQLAFSHSSNVVLQQTSAQQGDD